MLGALGAGVACGTLVHGYAWARHALQLTQTELPLRGLPAALDGLRIGFLTDLHLSELVPAEDVAHAVAAINAARPDLIVLGGDYVSFADRGYMDPVAELLSPLRAPHGVFGIVGNHDDESAMPSALRRRGIEMLLDDRTALEIRGERLELAGAKFWTRALRPLAAIVQGAKAPVLLLAHDPRRIVEAAELGVGAVLAGHTHGGQVVLPLAGAIAARKFPIAAGRLTRKRTELFVSRGVGTVYIPVRINCPPEVAVVTLRSRLPSDGAG
jgi:predicted MPP superfamily phosphohydrolase